MTRFDLNPFFRNSVGFDRLMQLVEAAGADGNSGYPPYNIEKLDQNLYRITMAVAGFSEDHLDIELRDNVLRVSGEMVREEQKAASLFLHRGIAERAFERQFSLADYIKVVGASLENGLLHIDLEREVPEEKRPRKIKIEGSSAPQAEGVPTLKKVG